MIGTDGTLPFDPQKIAEDILEAVQNPPAVYPWNPVPDAPKKRSEVKRKTVEEAIKWLNSPSLHRDKTRINLYLEKRTAHEESIKHKEDLFKKALEMSKADPRNESPQDQEASYHHWVAENHKRLHAAIQTAYMDWVTTANKTDVEYYLGHVDPDLNKAIKKVLESQEANTSESGKPSA